MRCHFDFMESRGTRLARRTASGLAGTVEEKGRESVFGGGCNHRVSSLALESRRRRRARFLEQAAEVSAAGAR